MKVVINDCHGGFGLSTEAFEELIKLGWTVTEYNESGYPKDKEALLIKSNDDRFDKYYFKLDNSDPELRKNKDLIFVIEKLGKKANGSYSDLSIIEIPDDVDFIIQDYDGAEWAAEKHRTWG